MCNKVNNLDFIDIFTEQLLMSICLCTKSFHCHSCFILSDSLNDTCVDYFGFKQATAIKYFFKSLSQSPSLPSQLLPETSFHFTNYNRNLKSENQMISTAVRQVCSYQSLLERFAFPQLLQGTSVVVCDHLRYAIFSPIRVFCICSLHIYRTQYQHKKIRNLTKHFLLQGHTAFVLFQRCLPVTTAFLTYVITTR